MTVLIFANGDIEDVTWIRPYLTPDVVIIAADGGSRYLMQLQRLPQVLIGDMDSLPAEVREQLPGVRVVPYPLEKNETDLELALHYAIENYSGRILVFGALGGRLDHSLSNILLLAHPAWAYRRIELVERYQRAWLVSGGTKIEGQVGDTVSLIPLGGDVYVERTKGLRWPLKAEMLLSGPARGVSNVMTETIAEVWLGSGRLLCIHTSQVWQR